LLGRATIPEKGFQMNDVTTRIFSIVDSVHYENIDKYTPTKEYSSIVQMLLPSDWRVRERGFWTGCSPEEWSPQDHGWKIHVSSAIERSEETLSACVPEIIRARASFKFCSDPKMLRLSLGKAWSRFQAGKFITIYPRHEAQFVELLHALHQKTKSFTGPHILTDKPYPGSRVVFYRYGAHVSSNRPDAYGNQRSGFNVEGGGWQEDVRDASFRLPPGISNPVSACDGSGTTGRSQSIVLKGRYSVSGALKFNGTGGIYQAIDTQTGKHVIVREVRGLPPGEEQAVKPALVNGLIREARILRRLAGSGLTPEFVDIFQEWNNWFLVEERIEAVTLWDASMKFYYSKDHQFAADGFNEIRATIDSIGRALGAVHESGVVLRDLTRSNVMVTSLGEIKFIDLEFAHEVGVDDRWIRGWTPGYASDEQLSSQKPTFQEDHYAFGVLILDILTFCASGMELSREAILHGKLPQVLEDLNFPNALYDIVVGLTTKDLASRWSIQKALEHLNQADPPAANMLMFPKWEDFVSPQGDEADVLRSIGTIISGFTKYLDASLDVSRSDRLWPAGPQLFSTNPVSLQFGAAGIAFFYLRSAGGVNEDVLTWIDQKTSLETCPPGLYSGVGGVALLLLAAGRVKSAEKHLRSARTHPLALSIPGLYFGAAGQGMLQLHFWSVTGDPGYLDCAISIADELLSCADISKDGLCWASDGKVYLGLGDGQSGIALFLIYVGKASGVARYLDAAGRALDFDIAHHARVAGRILWKNYVGASANSPNSPHTRFGASGIGSVCIRYFAATGDVRYKDVALDCAQSIRSRVSNKLWQDSGNAGMGEFLLDLSHFTGDEGFRSAAIYHAGAIATHATQCLGGIAFAGPAHYRICNEYSVGGAGIGIFLDRLANRRDRFMMLDWLLGRP